MNTRSNNELSIATFNTFGVPFFSPDPNKRYETFSSLVNSMEIDVLNLQEVHTYRLLRILQRRLNSFPYVIYERSLFGAKGGLVTFSRYPIAKIEYTTLAKRPTKYPKGLLDAFDLRDKGILGSILRNMPVVIINTHLTANMGNDWSRRSRYYSTQQFELEQLSKIVKTIGGNNNTVITTGDFNVAKDTELYEHFVAEAQVDDFFKGNAQPTYHQDFMPRGERSHCIDYIFCLSGPQQVTLKQTSLLFQQKAQLPGGKQMYLSDHIGLLARLMLSS